MVNKSITVAVAAIGSILASAYVLPSLANTQDAGSNFVQSINQEYLKVQQFMQQPIQDLTNDLNQGLNSVTGEMQSQIKGIQSYFDQIASKTVGVSGEPDLIRTGQEIENTAAAAKTGVLSINARVQGHNGRQIWNQQFTTQQADKLLSLEGQRIMQRENETGQAAVNISISNGEAAQSDYITQEVMKKIAIQNAQTATLLQQVQSNLQEQNKLTATANVNLTDISQNISTEQKRQQLEAQGRTNAVFTASLYSTALWNRSRN